jgi:amino acid transporter
MVAGGCWVLVTVCGLLRVELVGALLALIVLAEVAVITGFGAANLLAPSRLSFDTLTVTALPAADRPTLALLLVVAAFGFVGFETVAAYGEETVRPRRSITRAAYLSVLAAAVLYAFSAWAMSVAAGPAQIADEAAGRGGELIFDLIGARLAPWAVTLGRVLLLTGLVAGMISLHHTIARYCYALGREGVLPGRLGRTGARTSVPFHASVAQSVVAGLALAGLYLAGWDPFTQTYPWLTTAGALGVLVLLAATSLSALLFLNRSPNGEGPWRSFAAPALATILLGALTYLAFAHLPELLGVPSSSRLVTAIPAAYGAAVLFGLSYGWALRRLSPITYAGIGLGGTAVVVAPAVPSPRTAGRHRAEQLEP